MLLFDMDGTLIDSNGIWKDVDTEFLARRGLPYTHAYYEGVAHTIFPLAAKFTKEFCHLPESEEEIMAVLWEKEVSASYFRNVRKDLLDTFRSAGCGDVLVQRRGMIGLLPEKVQCDYYDWQKGESWAMNAYRGEYMSQYSWGEFTHGALEADERQI